jgi:hypothetical protein
LAGDFRGPSATPGVALGPRVRSLEPESAGRAAGTTHILLWHTEIEKRRKRLLPAFHVNSCVGSVRSRLDQLPKRGALRYAARGENGSANNGWPHGKEVSYALPDGMNPFSPGHLGSKESGGQQYGSTRRIRPSINGQEVRQQGCPRVKLYCLNSSPPGPCRPLGNDAETRDLAVVDSYEESDDLPGQAEPPCGDIRTNGDPTDRPNHFTQPRDRLQVATPTATESS